MLEGVLFYSYLMTLCMFGVIKLLSFGWGVQIQTPLNQKVMEQQIYQLKFAT